MSVIVKNLDESSFKIHVKGSPERLREMCKIETIPSTIHCNFQVQSCTCLIEKSYHKIF